MGVTVHRLLRCYFLHRTEETGRNACLSAERLPESETGTDLVDESSRNGWRSFGMI